MSPWSSSAGYGAGAFGQGGWSAAAVAKLGEYVAAMPHQPARKEEMARRRKLLQVDPTASANDDAALPPPAAAAAPAAAASTAARCASLWLMSLRAEGAGGVCAFLALSAPGHGFEKRRGGVCSTRYAHQPGT